MYKIVLNADVGEGVGKDAEIMPHISWCNIGCGAHAGDLETIKKTIDLALKHDVKIGAHPSYPDRKNFGRKVVMMPDIELIKTITDQIELVKYQVEKAGGNLHHVKPHGALYNVSAVDKGVARLIINLVKNIDKSLLLITPYNSMISYLCEGALGVGVEAFADRNYNLDLTLVSRKNKNALLEDPAKILDRIVSVVTKNEIKTIAGEKVRILCDTICVHGDHPNSVEILEHLTQNFYAHQIEVL